MSLDMTLDMSSPPSLPELCAQDSRGSATRLAGSVVSPFAVRSATQEVPRRRMIPDVRARLAPHERFAAGRRHSSDRTARSASGPVRANCWLRAAAPRLLLFRSVRTAQPSAKRYSARRTDRSPRTRSRQAIIMWRLSNRRRQWRRWGWRHSCRRLC